MPLPPHDEMLRFSLAAVLRLLKAEDVEVWRCGAVSESLDDSYEVIVVRGHRNCLDLERALKRLLRQFTAEQTETAEATTADVRQTRERLLTARMN